jgi:hypothetical protein
MPRTRTDPDWLLPDGPECVCRAAVVSGCHSVKRGDPPCPPAQPGERVRGVEVLLLSVPLKLPSGDKSGYFSESESRVGGPLTLSPSNQQVGR